MSSERFTAGVIRNAEDESVRGNKPVYDSLKTILEYQLSLQDTRNANTWALSLALPLALSFDVA